MHRVSRSAAILLLAFLFAASVYRARTQSFTADEAFTYNNYIAEPLRALLTAYDANNHVLNTWLEKLSAALFGASELTLRLPGLAGGALFLAAVFVLCRRTFGGGVLLPLSAAALALNPFTLDFLSAARGYGLALGLFLWAVEFVLRYFDQDRPRFLFLSALALGLAVAANLTAAFPGVALVCSTSAVLLWRRQWRILIDAFLLPGLLVAFLLLAIPLSYARPGQFYVGAPSLTAALESLVDASLFHSHPDPNFPERGFRLLKHWLRTLSLSCGTAMPALCGAALLFLLRRRCQPWSGERRLAALLAATFLGTVLMLVAVHRGLGLLYPERRTGLYLIPLFWLTAFALLRPAMAHRTAARILTPVFAVFLGLFVFQFARQWNTRYYLEWLYDSRTREIVGIIERTRDRARPAVTVSATWPVASTVEFYKSLQGLDWLEIRSRHISKEPADYYILAGEERGAAAGLEVVFKDEFAGVVLARPRKR